MRKTLADFRSICLRIVCCLSCAVCLIPTCGGRPEKGRPFAGIEEEWESRMGHYAGKLMAIHVNTALKDIAGNSPCRYQIAAGLVVKNPRGDGLPNRIESQTLKKVERVLVEKLVESNLTVHAIDIKTDGRCDYVFYGADKNAILDSIAAIGDTIGTYAVEFTIKRDPGWNTYTWFAPFGTDGRRR